MDGDEHVVSRSGTHLVEAVVEVGQPEFIRGLTVLTDEVVLRVIDVVGAGQEDLGDVLRHEVTRKRLIVGGQREAVIRLEDGGLDGVVAGGREDDTADGAGGAVVGRHRHDDCRLLLRGRVTLDSLQLDILQLDGAHSVIVRVHPHVEVHAGIEVVEEQIDEVACAAAILLDGGCRVFEFAATEVCNGIIDILLVVIHPVLGADDHAQVAGHDGRHILERQHSTADVGGVIAGRRRGGDAVADAHAVGHIAVEIIGASINLLVDAPFVAALEEVTVDGLFRILCEADGNHILAVVKQLIACGRYPAAGDRHIVLEVGNEAPHRHGNLHGRRLHHRLHPFLIAIAGAAGEAEQAEQNHKPYKPISPVSLASSISLISYRQFLYHRFYSISQLPVIHLVVRIHIRPRGDGGFYQVNLDATLVEDLEDIGVAVTRFPLHVLGRHHGRPGHIVDGQ